MGTDIHMFAEQYHTEDRQWRRVLPPDRLKEQDTWIASQRALALQKPEASRESMDRYYIQQYDLTWYYGRNYDLFAILADVRNHEDAKFNFISPPRGLPDDLSPEVREIINHDHACNPEREEYGECLPSCPFDNEIWIGEHSISYLTVSELLGFDWDQWIQQRRGHIPLSSYQERRQRGETGEPHIYAAAVPGRVYTEREAVALLDTGRTAGDSRDGIFSSTSEYVLVRWNQSYRDAVGPHWFKVQDCLAELAGDFPEYVRIVFGFDS